MNSPDLVNGTYACENDKMLNDVLKREFAFQRYVMSDWQAQMSTMSAAAGLDVSWYSYTSQFRDSSDGHRCR